MSDLIHVTITDEMLRPHAEDLAACTGGYAEADIQEASDALRVVLASVNGRPRYWVTLSGQVLRLPSKRPLIHNGRKPR